MKNGLLSRCNASVIELELLTFYLLVFLILGFLLLAPHCINFLFCWFIPTDLCYGIGNRCSTYESESLAGIAMDGIFGLGPSDASTVSQLSIDSWSNLEQNITYALHAPLQYVNLPKKNFHFLQIYFYV